jgi:hypothetical protein
MPVLKAEDPADRIDIHGRARPIVLLLGETFLFEEHQFENARKSAAQQLKAVQTSLEGAECPSIDRFSIALSDMTAEGINEEIDAVPSGYGKADKENDFIYVIQMEPRLENTPATLVSRIEQARHAADDYCRVNRDHADSLTLYVGRSKTLRARLRQHLGAESRGVYAMHMLRWASGIDAQIHVSYMKFEGQDDLLIQAIEDGLWTSLRPTFGRKGER